MNPKVEVRVQPLMDFSSLPDDQVRLYRSVYHLAFKLYLDYTTVPCKGYTSSFNMDFEDRHVNVTYTCKDHDNDDYYAIEHGDELDITRWLCSDVPIKEFRKLFGDEMSVVDMYRRVYDVTSKPKLFVSEYSAVYSDGRDLRCAPANTFAIPKIVLHIAERMVQDRYNANWVHYYCINKESFERYKQLTEDPERQQRRQRNTDAVINAFATIVTQVLTSTNDDGHADELVNGHSKDHFNIC